MARTGGRGYHRRHHADEPSEPGLKAVTTAPRAERLRDHFVGWQCRIRADAMRRRSGQPSPGMQPQVLSAAGEELAPAMTTLLVRRDGESFAPEFRHLARRTHDPRDRREAALAMLSERYYQYARDFSDVLTATSAAGSALADDLVRERRCVLAFAQDSQRYTLPCTVQGLTRDDPRREETWWHNALFNPQLPPDIPVLGFAPRWLEATADPDPDRARS